jgi:hypothetical protein
VKSAMGAAIALVRGQIALVQADGEQGSVANHGVPNAHVKLRRKERSEWREPTARLASA